MAGTLVTSTIQGSTLTDGTNSTSTTNCIQGSAKAWVNFNGVSSASIRTSYNISSVTRTGTGAYTVNFTNALTDGNYVVQMSTIQMAASLYSVNITNGTTPSSSLFQIQAINQSSGATVAADVSYVYVTVFR